MVCQKCLQIGKIFRAPFLLYTLSPGLAAARTGRGLKAFFDDLSLYILRFC